MNVETQMLAHRFFSGHCFNGVWDLMDKAERTPQEDLHMEHMAHASLWHWLQREDHTATHLSVGYWQLSRVYACLKLAETSLRFARQCLEISQAGAVEPFYMGYAYEALARSMVMGEKPSEARAFLEQAHVHLQDVSDKDLHEALAKDLAELALLIESDPLLL